MRWVRLWCDPIKRIWGSTRRDFVTHFGRSEKIDGSCVCSWGGYAAAGLRLHPMYFVLICERSCGREGAIWLSRDLIFLGGGPRPWPFLKRANGRQPSAREIANQIAYTDTQCQEHVPSAFTFRACRRCDITKFSLKGRKLRGSKKTMPFTVFHQRSFHFLVAI